MIVTTMLINKIIKILTQEVIVIRTTTGMTIKIQTEVTSPSLNQ